MSHVPLPRHIHAMSGPQKVLVMSPEASRNCTLPFVVLFYLAYLALVCPTAPFERVNCTLQLQLNLKLELDYQRRITKLAFGNTSLFWNTCALCRAKNWKLTMPWLAWKVLFHMFQAAFSPCTHATLGTTRLQVRHVWVAPWPIKLPWHPILRICSLGGSVQVDGSGLSPSWEGTNPGTPQWGT
jgi:hypothetical protein